MLMKKWQRIVLPMPAADAAELMIKARWQR